MPPGNWRGKNVFITGIEGFVGWNLANDLARMGANVSGLILDHDYASPYHWSREDRKRFRIFSGDIRDYWTVERAIASVRPDFIFHLAAITQVVDAKYMPHQTYDINIMGTVNVLEAARRIRPGEIVTVVASSDKAYGEILEIPVKEDTPLNPVHPYDVSKACGDFVARSYGRFYGERVAITRCGNIFGYGDINWQRLIPGTVRLILSGQAPILRGNGKHVREYNYVDNVVEACLLIARALAEEPQYLIPRDWGVKPAQGTMEALTGASWNISDENARLSSLDVVKMIQEEMEDDSLPIILDEAKDEAETLELNSGRIRALLGWEPEIEIGDGLVRTIDWIRDYLKATG